jgi:hypothetical protein
LSASKSIVWATLNFSVSENLTAVLVVEVVYSYFRSDGIGGGEVDAASDGAY